MKVSELIAALQKLPQDEDILIEGQYDDMEGACEFFDAPFVRWCNFVEQTTATGDKVLHWQWSNYANYSLGVLKKHLVLSGTYGSPLIDEDISLDKKE